MLGSVAGIVSYNPNTKRIKKNIDAVINQFDEVVIVDNASENISDLSRLISDYSSVFLIKNEYNKGIAFALNQICEFAKGRNAKWCLLLDQDSICSDNMIDEYSRYINMEKVGMLCPYIVDEYKITLEDYKNMDLPDLNACNYAITSGSFVNIDIWSKVGGFFTDLFIDGVDTDYSYNLRINGYLIYRINKAYIMHQQGNKTEKTHIYRIHKDEAGKRTIKPAFRFNYSLMRWYYMARNNLIIIKKYRRLNGILKPSFSYIIRFASVILLEKNKTKVMKSIYRGLKDGIHYKVDSM